MPSKLALGSIAGAVGAIAVAGAVFWPGSDPSPTPRAAQFATSPGPSTTTGATGSAASPTMRPTAGALAAGPSAPVIPAADSTSALCQVRPSAIDSLLGNARGTGRFEALRDAIPALQDRLEELRVAATGRPALNPVVTGVQDLSNDWSAALSAYDEGDLKAADAAMARADRRIAAVDATLAKTLAKPRADCA